MSDPQIFACKYGQKTCFMVTRNILKMNAFHAEIWRKFKGKNKIFEFS